MTLAEVMGLIVIPALAGGVSGWIYWLAAGRPAAPVREMDRK
jgi:hypothetical protein